MGKPFGLYVILTDPVTGYETCARAAVEEGVRYLQLRMKNTSKNTIFETAKKLKDITGGSRTLFIVNDDVDIAMTCHADGVHLGQNDLPVTEARKIWEEPDRQFGLSTHNEDQAQAAQSIKPDYIGVGPVFPTPTKADPDPVIGLETMSRMIASASMPAVAIGGINEDNLVDVLSCGAKNFCAVRAITQVKNPRAAIRRMTDIWASAMKHRNNS